MGTVLDALQANDKTMAKNRSRDYKLDIIKVYKGIFDHFTMGIRIVWSPEASHRQCTRLLLKVNENGQSIHLIACKQSFERLSVESQEGKTPVIDNRPSYR